MTPGGSGTAAARPEPPVYRPFALIAFGATVVAGTPLGLRLIATTQLGAPAAPADWLFLHAGLQVFGFFGTLIVGVAHHLLPRFTGRPVARTRLTPWLAALLGGAVLARLAGTGTALPIVTLAGALAHALAFTLFAAWVWRALDPPPLGPLRRHLAASSAWLALAGGLEVALRARAIAGGWLVPDPAAMRAVHATALLGGVVGWVVGVLVRAGPMFVPHWQLPPRLVRALPWGLALAAALTLGTVAAGPVAAGALARLGELAALGTVTAVLVTGGALRRARRALPMLARGRAETRIFRLAAGAVVTAALGAAALAVGGGRAAPYPLLADALRHLVAVGFLTAVIVAMVFRLIPVLEGTPPPWPWLRPLAVGLLLAAVVLRTSQGLVEPGASPLRLGVALSGVLVWLVLAATGLSLAVAMARGRRAAAGR